MYPPSRPQSIGEVLDSAFRIFRASLFRCLPYGILAMLAGQLQNIYYIAAGRPLHQFGGGDPLWSLLYVIGIFCGCLFVNSILLRQRVLASAATAQSPSTLIDGFLFAPRAFVVFVVALLAMGLCFIPLAAVARPYRTLGILVLCVPAAYAGVALSCSWVALLIGGKGIFGSMGYSIRLVRGHWWRTATIYSVGFAMLAVFYSLTAVIAAVLMPLAGIGDVAMTTAVVAVVAAALGAVAVPFYSAMALAVFGDLEVRREGTDLQRRIAAATAI